ncbi:class C sortase [Eubacterium sp. 1001713B170207_170306_E7]|uniref:class C sortase n=1 Tax=Eubacterium sp. 1001713B170207_170306_E7 TaxID=2787097 RepID=UPI001896A908|nr:class C sortase [Eubacterium sp. 1001713B170207_170306_E7]
MKRFFACLFVFILFLMGIGCLFFTDVVYFLAAQRQGKVIEDYQMSTEAMNIQRLEIEYQKAVSYNTQLNAGIPDDPFSGNQPDNADPYRTILNINNTMGTLEIPKIQVNLPIYHGTDDKALSEGVGHLKGTSLPVGGASTHAVLTGHRGYSGAKLFTDLDKLLMGDRFYLHVLDQTLTYEVDQILTVEPDQTEALKADPEQDYLTLLTCTPYQINSHRLLVRGRRVTETPRMPPTEEEEPLPTKGLILSFVTLEAVAVLIWYVKIKRRRK